MLPVGLRPHICAVLWYSEARHNHPHDHHDHHHYHYHYHHHHYPDGVAIERLWSVDGVYYFHRPECRLQCHSDLMEWYWSGIGVAYECVANMQINTPKTLRSGIGVDFESGIGVVITEWQWSVHSRVALECTLGVALEWQQSVPPEWHWSASQIYKITLQCHSRVAMEW